MEDFTVDDLIRKYPWNVARAALQDSDPEEYLYCLYLPGLQNAIRSLDDRMQTVLEMRYGEYKTLEAIGKEMGVTRERIRQLEAHALFKIRGLKQMYVLSRPYETIQMQDDNKRLRNENNELRLRIKNYLETANKDALEIEHITPLNVPIEVLDLSVRSYNALRRAGYLMVYQLLGITKEQLMNIPWIGVRHTDEIIEKLNKYLEETENEKGIE